jgi:hypothetical protein
MCRRDDCDAISQIKLGSNPIGRPVINKAPLNRPAFECQFTRINRIYARRGALSRRKWQD